MTHVKIERVSEPFTSHQVRNHSSRADVPQICWENSVCRHEIIISQGVEATSIDHVPQKKSW